MLTKLLWSLTPLKLHVNDESREFHAGQVAVVTDSSQGACKNDGIILLVRRSQAVCTIAAVKCQ